MRRKFFTTAVAIIYFVFLALEIVLADSIIVTTTVNVSATVPTVYVPPVTPPSGGGGGGGGGLYTPPIDTRVVFSGLAYPMSRITIIKNSVGVIDSIAGPDGAFGINLTGLESGWINFLLYAVDAENRRSASYSLPIYISPGAITTVSGIFLSPTIVIDKSAVQQGQIITVQGQSTPNSKVTITVNSAIENNFDVQANGLGWYSYQLNTKTIEVGDHQARSRSFYNNLISPYSSDVFFKVVAEGEKIPTATSTAGFYKPPTKPGITGGSACGVSADVNGDCKVNLVDFSILGYWYKRPKPPVKLDLKKNGKIDLADFSIMAYFWTG